MQLFRYFIKSDTIQKTIELLIRRADKNIVIEGGQKMSYCPTCHKDLFACGCKGLSNAHFYNMGYFGTGRDLAPVAKENYWYKKGKERAAKESATFRPYGLEDV